MGRWLVLSLLPVPLSDSLHHLNGEKYKNDCNFLRFIRNEYMLSNFIICIFNGVFRECFCSLSVYYVSIAFSMKFRQHTSILILLFIWFFLMSYFSFVKCLPSNVAVDISQNWCDLIEWHCTVSMGRLPIGTWNGIDLLRQIFKYKYVSSLFLMDSQFPATHSNLLF